MLTDGASFGLAPNEGAEALVLEQLHGLPKALRIDSVSLHADSAGREVVVVRGTMKRFLFSQSIAYTLALTLRPSKRPGHPEEVIVAEPAGPASVVGSDIRAFSAALDAAIVAGVELVMNDIARQVADGNLFLKKQASRRCWSPSPASRCTRSPATSANQSTSRASTAAPSPEAWSRPRPAACCAPPRGDDLIRRRDPGDQRAMCG